MDKKGANNAKDMKNKNYEEKKNKASGNLKYREDKHLPWWVELFFVQIGLPDKLLIKILKAKKEFKTLIKNDKKKIISFLFVLAALSYFYPVIKYSKSKLDCESNAKNYFIQNKNLIKMSRKNLRMLSTNFCNGGKEIDNFRI